MCHLEEFLILFLHVKRAEIGSMLHPQEFVEISSTIRASRIIKRFIEEIRKEENLPILEQIGEKLNPPGTLEHTINICYK